MDFIIKLFLLKKPIMKFKYNFIIVVMDRLIKNIKFISFTEKVNAEELAYIFLK